MAERIGVRQPHVSRIEAGGSYSPSIDLLLDRIALDIGRPDLTRDAFAATGASALAGASAVEGDSLPSAALTGAGAAPPSPLPSSDAVPA